MAQAMRAILLANATAATFGCRFVAMPVIRKGNGNGAIDGGICRGDCGRGKELAGLIELTARQQHVGTVHFAYVDAAVVIRLVVVRSL